MTELLTRPSAPVGTPGISGAPAAGIGTELEAAGAPAAGIGVEAEAAASPDLDDTAHSDASRAALLLLSARTQIAEASQLLANLVPAATTAVPGRGGSFSWTTTVLESVESTEVLRNALGAVQMRASVVYRALRIAEQRAAGMPRRDLGKGVADELAPARRLSPARAGNALALERVVVESMPRTLDLLSRGEITQHAADEVARSALVLDDADRARVDEDIAERLPHVSPRRAGGLARARADELDQAAALARHNREVASRHVSIRPISPSLVCVSALLPTAEGVAVFAALDKAASTARAQGVTGTRGQHMADALFSRVTGLGTIEAASIEIQLMMTDETLLGDGTEVAWIDGHAVPATVARRLALGGGSDVMACAAESGHKRRPAGADTAGEDEHAEALRFIRRLYTDPVTGSLREVDARRRRFTGRDRRFIEIADRTCRTPWCEARTRHIDHVERFADGGETSAGNGVGLCEHCNYVRELPGWKARMVPEESSGPDESLRRQREITTPAGRRYVSEPSPLRRVRRPRRAVRVGDGAGDDAGAAA